MSAHDSPIHVLIATGLYPPEIGGPATYAQMLEDRLPAHGFTLSVVPYGQVRHLSKWIRHAAFFRVLLKESKQADVIYALDPISVGLPAWLLSVVRRKPFMIRLGGDYAWEQGQQRFGVTQTLDEYTKNRHRAPFFVRILALVQGFVVRRANRVIVPSEYLKRIVTTWGVSPERITVIYSALFPLVVEAEKPELRDQLAFTDFTITSVGRLVPWKGFSALLRVIARLREAGHPVSLVIAGDGPEEPHLRELIAELNLTDHVRLVGRLSKDALGAIIKASDCFVLNTSYEGLSHQLLEVMDLGVPIVTTNVGGNPELITDGENGFLVPFNDELALANAIERFYYDIELRVKIAISAKVRIQDFMQDKVVLELSSLIVGRLK